MMLRHIRNRKQGFTLIELAIVLTIAGLMFAGLWRLLNGGNQQVRDQSAASQQAQLIAAVKGYLGDTTPVSGGVAFLSALNPNQSINLALPTSTNCAATIPASEAALCNYLPAGMYAQTPNAYGQFYNIQILKDGSAAGTAPNSYSFMITTTGGDVIPDTSGGRLSASIGNDGGFIYTGNVCNAQAGVASANLAACGSYGTWAVPVATYGLGAQTTGHIATRTYSTPSSNTFPWLARPALPGDTGFVWNTMSTNLYMGVIPAGGNSNIYLSAFNAANPNAPYANFQSTGGGNLYMQGGTITGQGTSNISLTGTGSTTNLLSVNNGCVITGTNLAGGVTSSNPGGCTYSIGTDNIFISGFGWANAFYSPNFNYVGSDIRFKTDVHPLTDALSDVMKLKPVSYTLKASGQKSMGVIAQDLEKVYPQLVSHGTDMKFVSYDGLIAPLIGAVQELKEENDRLRQQLHEQEQRQNELEKKLGTSKAAP